MPLSIRPWQNSAINKAIDWFDQKKDNKFLINAAPGAGKTYFAFSNELPALEPHTAFIAAW